MGGVWWHYTNIKPQKAIGVKGGMAYDEIITAAQKILKKQFTIWGFKHQCLGKRYTWKYSLGSSYKFFVPIATIGFVYQPSAVNHPPFIHVYEQHGRLHTHTQKLVADLIQSKDRPKHRGALRKCATTEWQ